MATYHTIERRNPFNKVKTTEFPITEYPFTSKEAIQTKVVYVKKVDSDLIEEEIDLTSDESLVKLTLNSGGNAYIFEINQENVIFKEFLINSNFYIIVTDTGNPDIDIHIHYTIPPSSVTLDNISIPLKTINVNGKDITPKGTITNSGNCELWDDYKETILQTTLKRIYYNNTAISGEDIDITEGIKECKENGGGTVYVGKDSETGNPNKTLTIDFSGLVLYDFKSDYSIEKINFLDCNTSTIISSCTFNTVEKEIKGYLQNVGSTFNLINSNITFIDCVFKLPDFIVDDRSSITFINCKFELGAFIYSQITEDNYSKVNFVKSNVTYREQDEWGRGLNITNIPDINFYQCEIDNQGEGIKNAKNVKAYTSKFRHNPGSTGLFRATDSITVENCIFHCERWNPDFGSYTSFETTNLKISKSYFQNLSIGYSNYYNNIPINVVITDTAAYTSSINISDDLSYTVTKDTPLSYIIVSNSTFLTPINSISLGPRDLVKSIIRYSTVIGSEVSALDPNIYKPYLFPGLVAEQFTSIQNCLVLATDETKPEGTTEAITGYDGIEAGSCIVYNKGYEVINHSNLSYPYSIFNGYIKCLDYKADIDGVSLQNLYTAYRETEYIVSTEYQSSDIFDNERSEDEAAKCGCEEVSYAEDTGGGIITYSYTNTSAGIDEANLRITKYQHPVLFNEYDDLDDEEQKASIPKAKWYLDLEQISSIIPSSGTGDKAYSYGHYKIDVVDRAKIITAKIDDYYGYELTNSVALRIAVVPVLRYESTTYTAWTNQSFQLRANIENAEEDILGASVQWFNQPDYGSPTLVSSVPVSSEETEEETTDYFAEFKFAQVKVDSGGKYFGKLYYTPNGFENQRIIQGIDEKSLKSLITISIKYNIIINQDKISSGNISLHVGDKLTLVSDLTQGSEPVFTWERTNDITDPDSWEVVYGPISNTAEYTETLYHEIQTPVYYRLHVYNYNISNDPSSGIATEDYSSFPVVLLVLPRIPTGNEINKNIVLFKVPLSDINNPEIEINNNYRLFTTLDNVDVNTYQAGETIEAYPVIHRRTDEQLWEFDSDSGNYVPTYQKYKFPSSVSIDKKTSAWGVATDELQVNGNEYNGGNLYILDLNTLNDIEVARTNKPVISENMMQAYARLPRSSQRIIFSSLGKKTTTYNNYIAVADPDASIIISKEFSEFDEYYNPTIFQLDNTATWEFILPDEYYGIPIFQLLDSENKVVDAEITFVHETNSVIVKVSWDDLELPAKTLKLLVAGRKQVELKENIVIHEEIVCPDLELDSDGYARWAFTISDDYLVQPIVQVVDINGTVVHPLIQYSAALKRFIISIKSNSGAPVNDGAYTAVLFGRNKGTIDDTDVIMEIHNSPILVPAADKGWLATWKIEFAKQFITPPIIQFQMGSSGVKTVDVTDIVIDSSNKFATITIKYNEILPSSIFHAIVIGRDINGHLDEDDIVKPSYGRVLLFKYNGTAKTLKLVKVIKSPHEVQYGRFGAAVEFDEYGNILISAPGEQQDTQIGYTEQNFNIYPVYTSDNYLKFTSRGRVYVFSIEKLVESEMHNLVQPTQILSSRYLFSTVSYQNKTWGELGSYFTSNSLYTIKDKETGGAKINEGFSTIQAYQEYYNFNYEYDFSYKLLFPTPYSEFDFKNGNSGNDTIAIEYKKVYSTYNIEEQYGSSISYNSGNLLVGAPYFKNNAGIIEMWNYNKADGKYVYSAALKNPQDNTNGLFGLFLEMGTNYFLATRRASSARQSVGVYNYKNGKIIDNDIELSGRSKEISFGESMDSVAETFVIAAPKEGYIYRYHINTSLEEEKPISIIQELSLKKFGISKADSTISISDDKILVTYNSYGPKCEKYVNKVEIAGKEKEIGLVNFGAGAVVQFTLVGGQYTVQ